MNNKRKNRQAKIVFRYQEEIMTLYNKSVKRFIKTIWFVSLMASVAYFMLDRKKFMDDFLWTMMGFLILILFCAYIWKKTVHFRNKVAEFYHHGKKTRGRILRSMVRQKDQKLCLEVEYTIPGSKEKKTFMTSPVTGEPSMLLKSPEVDVYILGDEKFATNFKLALEDEKPYGLKKGFQ
ncbi:MAG: hypothetical protein Q4P25_05540 [Tissierellia bacterium]|nr:hypothetical protein [Tissierellia bacterium]